MLLVFRDRFKAVTTVAAPRSLDEIVLYRDGFTTADAAFSNGLKGIVSATRM